MHVWIFHAQDCLFHYLYLPASTFCNVLGSSSAFARKKKKLMQVSIDTSKTGVLLKKTHIFLYLCTLKYFKQKCITQQTTIFAL
jgi:hypothetical protein